MKHVVPVEKCNGCSACVTKCPVDAISMQEDREGFLSPTVDYDLCTLCGNCVEICPLVNDRRPSSKANATLYAAWHLDWDTRWKSTSGGLFSSLAASILERNGVVFGAAFDESLHLRHIGVGREEDLSPLRGSKYLQSDIANSHNETKAFLEAGRSVLFTGTPCQIAGLYAYLGKDDENLYTCDLVCRGVPSPGLFRQHCDFLQKKYGSKVVGYAFRDKRSGWHQPTVVITFADGRVLSHSNQDDLFSRGFIKQACLRSSCHACGIKNAKGAADLTIGDFWKLPSIEPSIVDTAGISVALANSEKGRKLLASCRDSLFLKEYPSHHIEGITNLTSSARPYPQREAFFSDREKEGFEVAMQRHVGRRPFHIRLLAKMRRALLAWRTLRFRKKGTGQINSEND